MPFARPPLPTLISQSQADLKTRMRLDALLRRSPSSVYARVSAQGRNGLYGYLDNIAKNVLTTTSDDPTMIAEAGMFGLTQTPATKASGPIAAASVTGVAGTPIPAGSILQRSDQVQFATDADTTVGGAAPTVTALVAGSAGNTASGTTLSFVEPIANVGNTVTVDAAGLTGGNDQQTADSLRTDLLSRKRNPPQGGADADYLGWALAQPGVTRAWVLPLWLGIGTVGVTFVMDGRTNIIPLAGDVTAVQNALQALAPLTAGPQLTVFAPTPVMQNLTIHLNPNTADTQAAVEAALADFWARESTPGGTPTGNGIPGGTLYLSRIKDAIGNAPGVVDFTLTTPNADIVMPNGSMSVMGAITWT